MFKDLSKRQRGLSESFLQELENGILTPLLDRVKQDQTLCLDIRDNYINVYYRGGSLLNLRESARHIFDAYFDTNYFITKERDFISNFPKKIIKVEHTLYWLDNAFPVLKNEIDLWFGRNTRNEREFQQDLARYNNAENIATGTDYFICDIEYANTENKSKFDMIAVKWDSTASARKNNRNLKLAFIEVKNGDKALDGDSGIIKHIQDMENFLSCPKNLEETKDEMKIIFNQKIKLGLIMNQNYIESFASEKPEFAFIFANHDPESSVLKRELEKIVLSDKFDLKFAVSNFMGSGLYAQNMYDLEKFKNKFNEQIYK